MISVIMGMDRYDCYSPSAIDSILAQTFPSIELIVVANGERCHDIQQKLLERYPAENKLKIVKSRIPQLAHSLNVGVDNAAYDYIARMDSDDVASPERLAIQFQYLVDKNLDMVGCDLRLINETGQLLGTRKYPKGTSIDKWLSYKNCFAHGTVLIKKSIILKARGYNAGFNSEDYDLWLRLRRQGVKWDNVASTLVDYRIHTGASQRRVLGYAECTALAVREFILVKSVGRFFAIFYHLLKTLVRARDV